MLTQLLAGKIISFIRFDFFLIVHVFSRQSGISQNGSPYEGASSCCSGYQVVDSSSMDSGSPRSLSHEEDEIQRYRVVLLGDSGVGKTALVSQFMTSEYMNTYDASLGMIIYYKM